jgi:hypothetical protein
MKNIFKILKLKINNYLERLARENQKNFGNDKLDCCALNKNSRGEIYKNKHK